MQPTEVGLSLGLAEVSVLLKSESSLLAGYQEVSAAAAGERLCQLESLVENDGK